MNKNILDKIKCDDKDCFKDNFFTNSLLSNTAHASYDCLAIEQNPNFIFYFDKLFKENTPNQIVEIGTYHGGMTKAIRDIAIQYNSDVNIFTFDPKEPEYLLQHKDILEINIYIQNLFSEDYSDFADNATKNLATKLIQKNGRTYVLCDGGCKSCEFNLLAPLLKHGDIIMLHDYAESAEIFKKQILNKCWNWLEVQHEDIMNCCNEFSLRSLKNFETEKVGWGCFQKS